MLVVGIKAGTEKHTPRVEISIPFRILNRVKKGYGKHLIIKENKDDYVDIFSTSRHRKRNNRLARGILGKCIEKIPGLHRKSYLKTWEESRVGMLPRGNREMRN